MTASLFKELLPAVAFPVALLSLAYPAQSSSGHDFVDIGKGVVDNWSGASLLPGLFQSLKAVSRRHKFIFMGFTDEEDEEKGLVGSSYDVSHLSNDDLRRISGMVNLDSLGVGTTKMEMDRGDKRLADVLASVAAVSSCRSA